MTTDLLLAQAIDQGLTFADCVAAFAGRTTERQRHLIDKARRIHHREGEIEIDSTTITSGSGDQGDYVLAWVWVDDDQEAGDD